jgi:hypothetical protein
MTLKKSFTQTVLIITGMTIFFSCEPSASKHLGAEFMELHETDSGFVHLPLSKIAWVWSSKTLVMTSGMGPGAQTWTFVLEDDLDLSQKTYKSNCLFKESGIEGTLEVEQKSSETSLSNWKFKMSRGQALFDQHFCLLRDSAHYKIIPIEN